MSKVKTITTGTKTVEVVEISANTVKVREPGGHWVKRKVRLGQFMFDGELFDLNEEYQRALLIKQHPLTPKDCFRKD